MIWVERGRGPRMMKTFYTYCLCSFEVNHNYVAFDEINEASNMIRVSYKRFLM